MESNRKDINQMYREMEEAVAQKVRETMELADARRRALALAATQKQITDDRREKAQQISTEYINRFNENDDTIRTREIIADDDRLRSEEVQQELEDINRSIEEEQAKMYRGVRVDDGVKDAETTVDDVLQINFEHCDTVDNAEKVNNICNAVHETTEVLNMAQSAVEERDSSEIDHSIEVKPLERTPTPEEQISQINFELPINNSPDHQLAYDTYEIENEHELTQNNLNITQNTATNPENMFRQIVDNPTLAEPLQIITNPFDLIEDADSELQRNYGPNPFESSDDEVEVRLGEGTISLVQNWRNQTRNPFEDLPDIRELDEEGLNPSRNYTTNPFNIFDEEDMRQIGADALSIAQTGARHVDATKRQLSENAEDLDNAFNSLIDAADQQNPLIEIGFGHLEHVFEQEMADNDENMNYSDF